MEKQGAASREVWKMNRVIRGLRATFCLVKAWLGLPYMPAGILMLLAFSWFDRPSDLMLTATLLFALLASWLCRLQCEREQRFYKRLYMNCRGPRRTKRLTKLSFGTSKSCPVCNKTTSSENSFCPSCGTDLRGQKFNNILIPQKQS